MEAMFYIEKEEKKELKEKEVEKRIFPQDLWESTMRFGIDKVKLTHKK
jgi:hypothetical protein